MGYTTLLDIVGSVIIGGLLMLVLLRTNSAAVANTYNYGGDVAIQQSLSSLVSTLDSDFRKFGYSSDYTLISDPTQAILNADTSSITFLADLYNNDVLRTVNYYLSSKTELSSTTNPNDRYLYRVVTSTSPTETIKVPGVSVFRLAYFDSSGAALSCPVSQTKKIAKIQIYLKMESAVPYDNNYASTFWSGTKRIAVNVMDR